MKFLLIAVLLLGIAAMRSESKTVKFVSVTSQGGKKDKIAVANGKEKEENAPEKGDIFDINKDDSLIDGDIIPNKDSRNTLVQELRHWNTRQIPIVYKSSLSVEAIASIDYARVEYELRTCLSLVDRTTESDYIEFDTLNGCYSSIGRVGGSQTISIGIGCEVIGTVEHEVMHALGIYHEQSRTDRDDYVTIELDNVDSGKEHNFNTYSYSVVDERRVPYDYNSVMHYSDTAFSNNGQPTIVTKNPEFQDVIGQFSGFSPGDVTKINRMYKCGDTVRLSYSCNFDELYVCGYVQETTDSADWSFYTTSAAQQPPNHPTTDATTDIAGGSYMLFDTTQSQVNGFMYSMRQKSKVSRQCLEFSYHMKVGSGSATSFNVYVAQLDSSNGEIVSLGNPVARITGNKEYDWNIERLTIEAGATYKLAFEVQKDQADDVVAIDEVSVLDKPCETGYFVIRDYSNLIATSQRGDNIFSPIMYTEDGYAFQMRVYPVGGTSSSTGYMSLYYAVAMGDNDDNLQWPFSNRFIRFSVVDQASNTVERMSHSYNFVSSETNSAWQKPTSSRNGGYGYSNFMTYSDILNTRNFLKHDAVVISVEVKDMTSQSVMKMTSAMRMEPLMNFDNKTEEVESYHDDGYSEVESISIIALSAAATFIFMIIVIFIVNERNSKQLNKAMLNCSK